MRMLTARRCIRELGGTISRTIDGLGRRDVEPAFVRPDSSVSRRREFGSGSITIKHLQVMRQPREIVMAEIGDQLAASWRKTFVVGRGLMAALTERLIQ